MDLSYKFKERKSLSLRNWDRGDADSRSIFKALDQQVYWLHVKQSGPRVRLQRGSVYPAGQATAAGSNASRECGF